MPAARPTVLAGQARHDIRELREDITGLTDFGEAARRALHCRVRLATAWSRAGAWNECAAALTARPVPNQVTGR
jgi:hypothetical protein